MIRESEIREHLANYLLGSESLDDFEDWLVQKSWNMHLDCYQDAQELVGEIELYLSEYSGDYIDEESLKEKLRPFVEQYEAQVSFDNADSPSSIIRRMLSDSRTERFQVAFAGA